MVVWFTWLPILARRSRRIGYGSCFKYMKEVKYLIVEVTSMAKSHSEPLRFNSRSKAPFDKFSNFYEVKIEMPEGCFNSVEHYFQSMKFINENHSRFEINGELGRQGITNGNWKPTVSKGRFIKSAGSKSGTKKYGLTLRSDGLDRERAKSKMKEGLRKKFEKEPFKTLLLETLLRPLVHTPLRGKTDDWTARVDKTSGDIVGKNNMGKLLMEVRKELQEANENDQCVESKEREAGMGIQSKASEEETINEDSSCLVRNTEGQPAKKRKHEDSGGEEGGGETEPRKSDEPQRKQKKTGMKSDGKNKPAKTK